MGAKDEAKTIYQANLDVVSQALMAEDYGTIRQHLSAPGYLCSIDGAAMITDMEDLMASIRNQRRAMHDMSVDTYIRVCRSAAFEDPECLRIVGEHDTFLLCRGVQVIPPYHNVMSLALKGGVWRGTGLTSNVSLRDLEILRPDQVNRITEGAGEH